MSEKLIGKKVVMLEPTKTTTRSKLYQVVGSRFDATSRPEIKIRNNSGCLIYILRSRVRVV